MQKSVLILWVTILVVAFSCNEKKEKQPKITVDKEKLKKPEPPKLDSVDLALQAKLDSFFTKRADRNRFNGTVLVARKGKVVYKAAFGYADVIKKDTLTTSSAFQLASVSKPITALAVLKLMEQGKLKLDDTVSKYIPCFNYDGVTIRHLLSHRSGLPEYFYFSEEYWEDKHQAESNEDVVCMLEEKHPSRYWLPGRRYDYCNTNFCVLGAIIENVSGMEYGEFVESQIFEPLEMKDSFVYNEFRHPEKKELGVTGHHYNGRAFGDFYQNGVVGDKNIFSSVEDLYKLDQALYTDKLLSQATLDTAFTPHNPDLRAYDNYGLGWRVDEKSIENHKIVYHAGWWKGFKTYFFRILNNEATIIVLTNRLKGASFRKKHLLALAGY